MNQPVPDRTVAGPPARRPIDASRLLKDNRGGLPQEAPAKHGPSTGGAPSATPQGDGEAKEQITVAIRASVRQRSRSAFREASYRERTRTYSDFVDGAIDREIKRIETEYNDGKPLGPDAEPLTPGRTAGG